MSENFVSAAYSKRKSIAFLQKKYENVIKELNEKIDKATTAGYYFLYVSELDSFVREELTAVGYKVDVASDCRFRISWG